MTTVKPSEHAEVYPWSASGPGWANAGIYVREPGEPAPGTCVYMAQVGPRAAALFPVAMAAIEALERAIRFEGYRKSRS